MFTVEEAKRRAVEEVAAINSNNRLSLSAHHFAEWCHAPQLSEWRTYLFFLYSLDLLLFLLLLKICPSFSLPFSLTVSIYSAAFVPRTEDDGR